MKKTIGYLTERLLIQYYLIDSICRGLVGEEKMKDIFDELTRVMCIPVSLETEKYYEMSVSGEYAGIIDLITYNRFCRNIEFAQISGQNAELDDTDRVIISCKRDAMHAKYKIFEHRRSLTVDTVADILSEASAKGNICSMVTLAFMEYHGICISKDENSALKRIRAAAKWNCIFANLMGIAYDVKDKTGYYNNIFTIAKTSNMKEVFRNICEATAYTGECRISPTADILEKAFSVDIVNRNSYDRIFAGVVFSEVISAEDKEKLLLNKKAEEIVSLSGIPFDTKRSNGFNFDAVKVQETALKREDEIQRILYDLSPVLDGYSSLYQPLMVAANDSYVSDMYLEAIKAGFADRNKVIEVDASTLSAADLSGTKENFILRGLSETKKSHTVFLVKHCEEIAENGVQGLVKLLDYDNRRRFKLQDPAVSIDISDVLIILFASEINEDVRTIADECDVVWSASISREEKQNVIEKSFETRANLFGLENVKLEEEAKSYLLSLRTEQMIRLIDRALKKAAFDKELTVSAKTLKSFDSEQGTARNRREFGYLGGVYHEEY